jgi:hypothetical protein
MTSCPASSWPWLTAATTGWSTITSSSVPAEEPLPTVRYGDLALTSTPSADRKGSRVQVTQRQPDATWLRIIDRPEMPGT